MINIKEYKTVIIYTFIFILVLLLCYYFYYSFNAIDERLANIDKKLSNIPGPGTPKPIEPFARNQKSEITEPFARTAEPSSSSTFTQVPHETIIEAILRSHKQSQSTGGSRIEEVDEEEDVQDNKIKEMITKAVKHKKTVPQTE